MKNHPNAIVFFDGECGFCQWSTRFILQHEKRSTLYFAPLQGKLAKELLSTKMDLQNLHTVALMKDGKLYTKSDAVMEIGRSMKFPYSLTILLKFLPFTLRNRMYDVVAKNRHKFISSKQRCQVPSEEQRRRFLE